MNLKPGEIICDQCNGEGKTPLFKPDGYIATHRIMCNKCHGKGKLDWVEAIVGKKEPDIWFAPHGIRRGEIYDIKTR